MSLATAGRRRALQKGGTIMTRRMILCAVAFLTLLAGLSLGCDCGGDEDDDDSGNPFEDDDIDNNDDDGSPPDDDTIVDDDVADDDTEDLPRWLLDRPYLQDRSAWAEDIDLAKPPLVRQLGPVGVGNGRVFGLIGNQYPLGSWHNLGGPTYQKDYKWFTDKVPYLWGGGWPRNATHTALSYVRHTPIAITTSTDGALEWTSVNFAPRGDGVGLAADALISVWIVRNMSDHPIKNIVLMINGWLARFRDGALMESDMNGRFLYMQSLNTEALAGNAPNNMMIPFGELAPNQEHVVIVPLVFVEGNGGPYDVLTAIDTVGIDALLEATVAWWTDWAGQIAQIDTPDEKINDLLDALALSIKVNQAETGALSQMSQYSNTWLRDTHGPSLFYPPIGLADDYRDMLDYLYGVSVLHGNISNALPVDEDLSNLPAPPDWRNLGTFSGRERAEGPSFLVLEYENYYRATGDRTRLEERYDMFWHALFHQQLVDGCLEYYSSDETFEDVKEAAFGEWILNEPDESLLSSYSSFVMIRAARFLAQLATELGETADAAAYTQLADNFTACLDDVFWLDDHGHYAIQADTATREPDVRPYEDINTMPLWLDLFDRDAPHVVDNFEAIMAELGRDNGTLYSELDPMYQWLFSWVKIGVQTGMAHGYWLVNLDKMFHPAADEAFRRIADIVTPTGFTDEALIIDDYSHLSLFREPLGIVGDTSARYRSWESGIVGHAVLYHLTGYSYDVVAGTAELAPHLPPEWDHVTLTGLAYGDGRFDFDVRADGVAGRRITLTTDAQTTFTLDLTVPLDGEFVSATINGEDANATAAVNAYGRTVVRFAPFAVAAGGQTEVVIVAN